MSLNKRLQQTITHAYSHAPAVRQLMDTAGVTPNDIQSIADLPKIPVTTKDQLAQMQRENPPFGGWLAVPVEQLQRIFVSPGPIFEVEDESDEWDLGAFKAVGIGPKDIVINAFAYHLVSAGMLLDSGARGVGATVVPTGPGNTEYQVEIMMRLQASAYTGTPSFFKIILEKAEEMGIAREETFGPVACVTRVPSVDEAVRRANDTHFGLGAVVFGEDEEETEAVARRLTAGMIGINKAPGGARGTPWVGARQSGYGFHKSRDGHRQFTQTRVVTRPKRGS